MAIMAEEETIKVTLRIPKDIYDFIKDSCVATKTSHGKEVKRTYKLNERFVQFLWRGINDTEDDDGSV